MNAVHFLSRVQYDVVWVWIYSMCATNTLNICADLAEFPKEWYIREIETILNSIDIYAMSTATTSSIILDAPIIIRYAQ